MGLLQLRHVTALREIIGKAALASARQRPQLAGMETLSSRLEQLAAMYHLQIGPLVMVFGVSLANSPLLAWTTGVLIALETLNKLYHVFRRTEPRAG